MKWTNLESESGRFVSIDIDKVNCIVVDKEKSFVHFFPIGQIVYIKKEKINDVIETLKMLNKLI